MSTFNAVMASSKGELNSFGFGMDKSAPIYVAGHRGLVGSAIVRALTQQGFGNLVLKTSKELDLRNQNEVEAFYAQYRPQYLFLAAAKVGGIHANDSYPAQFLYDNLMIEANLIHGAYRSLVKKLLFLGSSCIYPRLAPQPLKEEYLLSGPLEPTNEWYAVAKIAGIKLCQAYRRQYGFDAISLMPTNLYGPQDNFDLENAHVLPALMRRFHEAKINNEEQVTVWGSGSPKREFLHVDDLASASLFLMESYSLPEIVNIGVGKEISIGQLAELVKKVVGFPGRLVFDTGKPDGTPRKLLDVSRLNSLGWQSSIDFEAGIRDTYEWYLQNG